MSPGEIAVAVAVTTAGTLVAGGLGGLAWVGRRLVSKFDGLDKAVRGNGASAPGLRVFQALQHEHRRAPDDEQHDRRNCQKPALSGKL